MVVGRGERAGGSLGTPAVPPWAGVFCLDVHKQKGPQRGRPCRCSLWRGGYLALRSPGNINQGRALVTVGGGGSERSLRMQLVTEFRRYAQECRRMADMSRNKQDQDQWKQLGDRWLRCAENLESEEKARALIPRRT